MNLVVPECDSSPVCAKGLARTLARETVDEILHKAKSLINSDPYGHFLYGRSKQEKLNTKESIVSLSNEEDTSFFGGSTEKENQVNENWSINWIKIKHYNAMDALTQIRDFINLWQLDPITKFALVDLEKEEIVEPFGKRFFLDATFSKPTPRCPNPLATATVHFYVTVSKWLPKYFPIMVSYQFEGYKSIYRAVGSKRMSKMHFQRFYIEGILSNKLAFYDYMVNCRHPREPIDDDSDIKAFDNKQLRLSAATFVSQMEK